MIPFLSDILQYLICIAIKLIYFIINYINGFVTLRILITIEIYG